MMWGRWQTFGTSSPKKKSASRKHLPDYTSRDEILPVEKDRRERARIVVKDGAAILFSAPIFNVGKGNPYEQIENLGTLGPDVLPYKGNFNSREFRRRLLLPEYRDVTIGAALLNQGIVAGLGNYLRAEVLFQCRMNPWKRVRELEKVELNCLGRTAPELSLRAYTASATAPDADRARMKSDPSLVYQPGREYGTRHMVFRRTNLPCLRCRETIRQLRQPTYNSGEEGQEERTRIMYFCPGCQKVDEQ
jgi:formamidopyrimidine-DNA glycosylase